MDSLVTQEWLATQLGAADLRVLDASWFLPGDGRDAVAEFAAGHIPGAVFFDLSALVDASSGLPMTLPKAEAFADAMAALGLSRKTRIVIYDNSPHHTSTRAWFMLARVYGYAHVAILDGGLDKWIAEGRVAETGRSLHSPVAPEPGFADWSRVKVKGEMLQNLDTLEAQVMDARGPGRFSGEEPEPRPGMASGHIPGARNLPYAKLFAEDGSWKRGDALASAFTASGLNIDQPLIATCGSGISACVLLFGAHLLGRDDAMLYDGSWAEWGIDPYTPKAIGDGSGTDNHDGTALAYVGGWHPQPPLQ